MSTWATGFLLALAPLLFLVALLLLGHYPGESTIARTRRAISLLLRPAAVRPGPEPRTEGHHLPARVRNPIASSLAGRAPPLTPMVPTTVFE